MARLAVLAVLVCALLVSIVPAANAGDAWVRWKDQSVQQYMEVVEIVNDDPTSLEHYVWQFGDVFSSPGLLLDDNGTAYHDADVPGRLRVVGGGSGDWHEGQPSTPIYVRLLTKIKNTGTEGWRDFHLRAINGCEVYAKYDGAWSHYWNSTDDMNGWDYIMDPTAEPSWGPEYGPVYPGEYFTCETWLTVTSPTGDFEVELWPTVPEPSALLCLGLGATGLIGHVLRRKPKR